MTEREGKRRGRTGDVEGKGRGMGGEAMAWEGDKLDCGLSGCIRIGIY